MLGQSRLQFFYGNLKQCGDYVVAGLASALRRLNSLPVAVATTVRLVCRMLKLGTALHVANVTKCWPNGEEQETRQTHDSKRWMFRNTECYKEKRANQTLVGTGAYCN